MCVSLAEGCAIEEKAKIRKSMYDLSIDAKVPLKLPRGQREDIVFCVLEDQGELADAIRTLCGLPAVVDTDLKATEADVVVLDLSSEQFSVLQTLDQGGSSTAVLKKNIGDFTRRYKGYGLTMSALRTAEGKHKQ